MNEIQLLLWPVVISALKKKKGTKKPNQTQQTNKQKAEFKKEPECNYGEVWEV